MRGSDFMNVYECVSQGCECCEPLVSKYDLLSATSSNYLRELKNVQDSFVTKPVTPAVMQQYKHTVKPIIQTILPDLQKLIDDEFELQMLNGHQAVKIGVAYFNEAIKQLEKL